MAPLFNRYMPDETTFGTCPLVTIAVPTLDRLDYLREAVESALAQTYRHIEVLIGDDGLTETIQARSEQIASQDGRVRYQRNEHTLGLAGNWNALADAARGEFLVIIGDDDRLLPEFVKTLLGIVQPSGDVAFGNHYLIDSRGLRLGAQSLEHTQRYRRDGLPAGEVANAAKCVWQNSVPLSAALVRTSDIQRLRFKEDLNTPEIELFVRLANEGARFIFHPDYLSEYRIHSQSATSHGLRGERLAEYLLQIPVAADVEPYKREFMESLLVSSVGQCLQKGEWERARRLLSSGYYPRPRWKHVISFSRTHRSEPGSVRSQDQQLGNRTPLGYLISGWVHGLCASLPATLGRPIYRSMVRTKSVFKKARSVTPSAVS